MAAKVKFYVVWRGRKPGIYASWTECEAQVKGVPQAAYKAFPTRQLAEQAFQDRGMNSRRRPAQAHLWDYSKHPPVTASVAVDAACSGNPGALEWRGVHTASGKEFFHMGPFARGTNNIGEFLAIVQALTWLKQMGNSLPVYSDSSVAISWVRQKKCKTSLAREAQNAALSKLIAGAQAWLAENEYENRVLKWDTAEWGQIPADFNRK